MKFNDALVALKFRKGTKFALTGSNSFLKEQFIKTAIKTYPDEEVAYHDLDSQEDCQGLLSSEELFSRPLLVIRDYDKQLKLSTAVERFDGVVLLVLSEDANLKSRATTEALSHVVVVECPKYKDYGNDYPVWILSYIADVGFKAESGVESLIFSKIGSNLFVLASELDKLFLLKEDKAITAADVKKYLSNTAVSTSFDLFDNLLRGNTAVVLNIFESYSMVQDSYIEIAFFLGSFLEKLYRVALLYEVKTDTKDIADIIGIPAFIIKTKYLPRITSLGKNFIAKKIDAVCKLDVNLRLFKGSKKVLVENFLLNFSS